MQAIQSEAERVRNDSPMSIAGGQHKLALLYIMDAVCSATKAGSKSLTEKQRTSFRKACSHELPAITGLLVTPLNCGKVCVGFSGRRHGASRSRKPIHTTLLPSLKSDRWSWSCTRTTILICASRSDKLVARCALISGQIFVLQVDDLLKLWARRGAEPVFDKQAIAASEQQLNGAKAQRAQVLARRTIGDFIPCSHGRVAPLQVRDWYGTFGPRRTMPTEHPPEVRPARHNPPGLSTVLQRAFKCCLQVCVRICCKPCPGLVTRCLTVRSRTSTCDK